jgi:heptosyltransferase-2
MPSVNDAIELPFGHGALQLKRRWHFGRDLATRQFSQCFVLPNSWKSALVPFAAKIPVRTGWLGEVRYGLLNDYRQLNKDRYPTMISRFNALALPAQSRLPDPPTPRLAASLAQQQAVQTAFDLTETPYVALCPGAEFGPAKRWPPTHYAKLIEHIWELGMKPVLLGSPKDQDTTAEVISQLSQNSTQHQLLDLAGRTDLTQAIDLLAGARAVVTNDSGLMHIAAAVDRPIIALYGPTSTTFTPPASEKATLLQLSLRCQPCHQRVCPLAPGEDNHACMKQIPPQKVAERLQSLL